MKLYPEPAKPWRELLVPCLTLEGGTKSSMKEPLRNDTWAGRKNEIPETAGRGGCQAVLFLYEVVLS